jgi:hypothetical protein
MVDDNTKEILRDIRDNTNSIQVDPPVGGATEAKQDAIITAIEAIPGGGGTQYTEADIDASITGTAVLWEDTSDTLRPVSADKPLPVNIVAGAGSGGTASADDADFTAGTTSGTPAMGVYESTPTTVTDGDLGTLGITSGRRLKTSATVDAALPAGTNNIGDVDVLSSALPTGASTLAEQQSQTTHLATIAGDTTSIQTAVEILDNAISGNEMQVDVITMPTTTVTGTVTADLSATDNAVLDTIDAVLDTIAAKDFATQTTLAAMNAKMVTGTDIGDVTINNSTGAAAVNIQDGGNTITVDGAVSVTNAGTFAVQAAATLAAETTKVIGTVNIAAAQTLSTVTTVGAVTAITNALPAGTNAIGKLAANSGVDIGDVDVTSITGVTMSNAAIQSTGDEAHDAVDAGNPMKIGGRAQEPTAAPDEVADNDRVDTLHDRVGRIAVYQGYPRWYAAINAATSGNNTIKAAAGAGKKIVVTSVSVISDGTVDIRWESGADGTALSGQMPLLVNTGYSASDPNGLFETAANTLLNLELSGAVNVHGHIAGMIIDD